MQLPLFFFKNFYKNFLIFLLFLSLIFVSGDLFVRLSLLPTFQAVAWVFFYMLPLMISFAMPIAACLAVQVTIGNLYISDEILFLHYFLSARKVLYAVVFIFSSSLLFLYAPLVFHVVPQSYKKGKQFILNYAKEQFHQMQADKMYNLLPNFTIYFKDKDITDNQKPKFYDLLLSFQEKKERYLVTAKEGFLGKNILVLRNGVMQNIGTKKFYTAQFEETQINLKRFWGEEKVTENKQLKFFTWKKLKKNKNQEKPILFEYHKRIAQVLWQFLLPFLSLFLIFLFGRSKSNLLLNILLTGFLFFIFYFSINIEPFISNYFASIIILYATPILLLLVLLLSYKRKYNL